MSTMLACLVNGIDTAVVSSQDRGLHYGDGLFETIAVAGGVPLLWERHLARLAGGAIRLGMPPPPADSLHREAQRLCAGQRRAVLKVILTRGVGGRGYAAARDAQPTRVLSLFPWPDYPREHWERGVAVRVCGTRLGRNCALAGIKHLNRLEQVLARSELGDPYAEGLMLDEDDRVIEGTMSNLFAVIDGQLTTPDLGNCGVAGIMRGLIIECARDILGACRIQPLTRSELFRASEVFLSNSLIGIWPVRRIDEAVGPGHRRHYPPGPVARQLQQRIAANVPPP
jgi:4-amino-4-deoxychorismate lyase